MIVLAILVGWLDAGPAISKKPSARMIERLRRHQQAMRRKRVSARPWREALGRALRLRRKPATTAQLVAHTFAATYKHYNPATHATRAALDRWAAPFAKAWRVLDRLCRRHGLDVVALAATIYQLTNSDYLPVPCNSGSGHDDIKTGKHYLRWGKALVKIGARHPRGMAKMIWSSMARSMTFSDIATLEAKRLKPIPPPPRCW